MSPCSLKLTSPARIREHPTAVLCQRKSTLLHPELPLTYENPYAYAEQYFGDSPIGHGKFDRGLFIPAQDYQSHAHDYLVRQPPPW